MDLGAAAMISRSSGRAESDALRPAYGADSLRYALLIFVFFNIWAAYHYWRAGRFMSEGLFEDVRRSGAESGLLKNLPLPSLVFAFLGAVPHFFDAAPLLDLLWRIDPSEPSQVEAHAETLVEIFTGVVFAAIGWRRGAP